jgi:RNA recognition motif-containing protein
MKDPSIAEKAIKTLRGYPFFGKPLRLNFAKKEADYVTKLSGTFEEAVLKKRNMRRDIDVKARELKQKRKMIDRLIKLRRQTAQMLGQELDQKFGTRNTQGGGIYKILFIERLPKHLKSEGLTEIFAVFHGFIEVRHIADKGYAFVEFVSDDFAAQAL